MERRSEKHFYSSSKSNVKTRRKFSQNDNQVLDLFSLHNKIKVNGLEKHEIKASIDPKFPSFHDSIGPVLAVGQLFGNMPVKGVLDPDIHNIEFKWLSFRTIYALVYILVGTFEVCLMVFKGFTKGFNIVTAELIMFYFDSVAQSCIFLFLATKWKDIISYWQKMEKPFLTAPYKIEGISLAFKIRIIGIVFMIFFLIEHLMFAAMELHVNHQQLVVCNVTNISVLHNYMRRLRPHLLDVLPYYWWLFPPFQWTLTLLAFCWNYVDFFIITISLGLLTRFNQLNCRLRSTPSHLMDRKLWFETRIHFTSLVDLLEFIDSKISLLVLFSMSHNLFLVITKIFEAIRYSNRLFLINNIYFYFYIFFLLLRTSAVLFSCSSVHNASSYPLIAIRRTPTTNWSVNLKRLSHMIQTEDISFSGSKFFHITRQMILAMVGSIVTFELVLLDRGSRDSENDLCSYFKNQSS